MKAIGDKVKHGSNGLGGMIDALAEWEIIGVFTIGELTFYWIRWIYGLGFRTVTESELN